VRKISKLGGVSKAVRANVLREFSKGERPIGGQRSPRATNKGQALAIALSKAGTRRR
jgi:hypothetical protein